MNKFTKISAAALFALFLTACDKPANKAADAPKAETTPAAQTTTAEATKIEAPKAEAPADPQGVADYKALIEWNVAQEKALQGFQEELQQKLSSQDQAQVEEGLKNFKAKIDDVLKSLDALEIKNPDVASFKAKNKEMFILSNELITESVKAITAPNEELQKTVQEKTQNLLQKGAELQQLQAELQQKFGSK